jgi:hypothetical protein
VSEIEERRQRAREAFQDASGLGDNGWHANEQAIETATRVQITDEMLAQIPATRPDAYDLACNLFTAAGFEVEA